MNLLTAWIPSWNMRSIFVCLFAMAMACVGLCADSSIDLAAYPEAIVADGVSSLTITATVRDKNGGLVPDGTNVLFESSLGSFKQAQVATTDGVARAILTSGTLSGTAQVTVSVLSLRASARLAIPFVKTRAELNAAGETVEIAGPKRLTYSPSSKTFRADGADQGVQLRYGRITIRASDLQFELETNEVKAKDCELRIGETAHVFRQLKFNVQTSSGLGIIEKRRLRTLYKGYPPLFKVEFFEESSPQVVEIVAGELQPTTKTLAEALPQFQFRDIYNDPTLIYARRGVSVGRREVQFQSATIDVNGTKVMSVPRFRIGFNTQSEVITDEFVQVSNNQVAINFPYYLGLSAGNESLFRLRYGARVSRGVGGIGGLFLDFEKAWNTSSEARGGMALRGIGRNDWGLSLRQSFKPTDDSRAFLQADLVAWRNLFGSAFADKTFSGWRATYSANSSRNIRGLKYQTADQYFNATLNPVKAGKLPVQFTFGLGASDRSVITDRSSGRTSTVGFDIFATMTPQNWAGGNLTASARTSKLWGRNLTQSITSTASLGWSKSLNRSVDLNLGYDLYDDAFSALYTGKHRVTLNMNASTEKFYFSTLFSKSLDIDRYNAQLDASYRFSPLWRVGSYATLEGYSGSKYTDSGFLVAYRLGYREVGVSWSPRTKRVGLELLGVPIH